MEIYRYGEVTSTNDIAKDFARQGVDAAVVIAESQSAGRGRRGRSFLSPAGRGLYVSLLWRPLCSAEDLLPLTAMAAAHPAASPMAQTGGMIRMLLCSSWSTEIARHPISKFVVCLGRIAR